MRSRCGSCRAPAIARQATGSIEHVLQQHLVHRPSPPSNEEKEPATPPTALRSSTNPIWLDGDVEAGVLDRLGSSTRADDSGGFFFADRFTFGRPLYRSRLEAAIQGVPGVAGEHAITYRQRGTFAGFVDLPDVITPGPMQILRVDNDPSWPERGTIRVIPEGGR